MLPPISKLQSHLVCNIAAEQQAANSQGGKGIGRGVNGVQQQECGRSATFTMLLGQNGQKIFCHSCGCRS